jgi:murein DD-endopeptidase MepM/ murein hydrolase activator NlpD
MPSRLLGISKTEGRQKLTQQTGNRGLPHWIIAGLFVALRLLPPCPSYAASTHLRAEATMLPPVEPACVSSPFGPRILPNRPLAGTFHNGIDLAAPIGSPVVAVAPGRVIRVQRHGIGGLEVLIQHDGFIGVYSHLGLIAPTLAEGGKTIYGGERIATVGRTGLTYGPHLYFGMIVNGSPVDPVPYLGVAPCGFEAAAVQDSRIRPTRLFAQHRTAVQVNQR